MALEAEDEDTENDNSSHGDDLVIIVSKFAGASSFIFVSRICTVLCKFLEMKIKKTELYIFLPSENFPTITI